MGDLLIGINPHVLPAGGDAVPGGEGDAAWAGVTLGNYSRWIVSMCLRSRVEGRKEGRVLTDE